jgi:hypothetical protein
MGTMKLHLHFAGASRPVLVETKFGAADAPLHCWSEVSPHATAVYAFAALALDVKLSSDPLVDERAVALLRGALHEVRRSFTPLKWPTWLFDDPAVLQRLLVFDGLGKARSVTLLRELLSADGITIVVDGKTIANDDRRLLQRLREGLLDRCSPHAGASRGELLMPPAELVPQIRESLNGSAARVTFVVGEREWDVPWLAAQQLIETLRAHLARAGSAPLSPSGSPVACSNSSFCAIWIGRR